MSVDLVWILIQVLKNIFEIIKDIWTDWVLDDTKELSFVGYDTGMVVKKNQRLVIYTHMYYTYYMYVY